MSTVNARSRQPRGVPVGGLSAAQQARARDALGKRWRTNDGKVRTTTRPA